MCLSERIFRFCNVEIPLYNGNEPDSQGVNRKQGIMICLLEVKNAKNTSYFTQMSP
jgi:hypothetical protein